MGLSQAIAKRFKAIYFGNNWTNTNIQEQLMDLNWQLVNAQVNDYNTIALFVYHINYYVEAVMGVLEGKPLDAHDKYSFDLPPIEKEEDWEQLRSTCLQNAEKISELIEGLSEEQLWASFVEEKYGTFYDNIVGLIEHNHYHFGQIVLIKKTLLNPSL